MLSGLDLFSGVGGFAIGLHEYIRPIAYCEQDEFCQQVLIENMRAGRLPEAPVWDDVRTFPTHAVVDRVDIVTAGWPCQDISVCGAGRGLDGSRSGLISEVFRCVRDLRPQFVFLENSPAVTVRGIDRILLGFDAIRYDARWTVVSAAEVGAPHLRERFFLLASDADRIRIRDRRERSQKGEAEAGPVAKSHGQAQFMAHAARERRRQRQFDAASGRKAQPGGESGGWGIWEAEPGVRRVVTGIPGRLDRLKSLGNSVVPSQAAEAFERLLFGF